MQLNHIALIVSKEENLAFYKKFGFAETNRFRRAADTVVFMEKDGLVLEIFVDARHPERVNPPETLGLRHIAFALEDFDKTVAEFDCDPIRTDFFGRRFTFTKDWDGQPIELKEMQPQPQGYPAKEI